MAKLDDLKKDIQSKQDEARRGRVLDDKNDSKTVMESVGKWAMPTTVALVLITCLSGFYLSESAFTPVVGMIAPVVMALIMVIKEASVGSDTDSEVLLRESDRKERMATESVNKELSLKRIESEQEMKREAMQEQSRQYLSQLDANKEFARTIQESHNKIVEMLSRDKSTELDIGDTHIKISGEGSSIKQKDNKQ